MLVEPEERDDARAPDETTEREDVSVGEVDQLKDAVDERVAKRDERVDRPLGQPDQEDVEEIGLLVEVEEVLDQPDPEQDEEEDAENRVG